MPNSRFSLSVVGLLLTVVTVGHAQQLSSRGQTYFSRLGCWNCHGRDGHGGIGKPGGPYIADSRLPLRKFVGYVRLPIYMMPNFAPEWAPDRELAYVYSWLGGVEAVKIPLPLTVTINNFAPEVQTERSSRTQAQFDTMVLRVERSRESAIPPLRLLRYRLTLITNGKAPVAHQELNYRRPGFDEWSNLTTDKHGEALLTPNSQFIIVSKQQKGNALTQLRMATPAVRTVVVIEALGPRKPVVLGVGSAIVAAERKR